MNDLIAELERVRRSVASETAPDGPVHVVELRRTYDGSAEDVWDACTNSERLPRWFLPISGDLRAGGSFQLEGNAGGEILSCEPPRLLKVTFGAPTSIVEVRLTPDGDGDTVLELEHTVPIEIAQSGAGALWVGPGWDGALLGLGLFLRGEAVGDPVAAASSPEARAFSKESVHAWAAVVEDSGTATAEQLAAATEVSLAQFAPDQTTD